MVQPKAGGKRRQGGEHDTMVRPTVKKEAGRRRRHNGQTNGEKRGRVEKATQWSEHW